jgi:hypothetical protein
LASTAQHSTAQHSTAQHSTLRQLTKRLVQVTAFTASCLVVLPSFVQTADAQTCDGGYGCWDEWNWIDDSYDECDFWGCDSSVNEPCDSIGCDSTGDEADEVLPPNNNYSINYSTEYLIHKGRTNKIFIKKDGIKVNGDLS